MNENKDEPEVTEKKKPEPLPIDPEDRLDWDFDIGERPPPIRRGKLLVYFRWKEAEPMPYPDPDEE